MDRGAWRATVQGVTEELAMTERLHNNKDCVWEHALFSLCVQREGSYSVSISRYLGRCRMCFILGTRSCSGISSRVSRVPLGCWAGPGDWTPGITTQVPWGGGRFRAGLEEEGQVCACFILCFYMVGESRTEGCS